MAARDLKPWTYTTDTGGDYVRRSDAFIHTQVDGSSNVKVGGASAASLTPYVSFPRGWRPRRAYVSSTDGYKGSVVVYDTSAPLWGASPPTINLRDAGGTSHTCSVDAKIGERLGRAIGHAQ